MTEPDIEALKALVHALDCCENAETEIMYVEMIYKLISIYTGEEK